MATLSTMLNYDAIPDDLQHQIIEDRAEQYENLYRCRNEYALRRHDVLRDTATLWRPAFVRDTEKILHLPVYNRYADKTQVFSFYNNDDITRRALHVQLVSRIARNIGSVLGLNLDLIEAIALGHDIGHTPFGHAGERYLSELFHDRTGNFFNHNVHSVRILDAIFHRNLTLQTLDGIICHNGEFGQMEYRPSTLCGFPYTESVALSRDDSFALFDKMTLRCMTEGESAITKLVPATLEGCVVRICDMIAYIGKDRQDAQTANIITHDTPFSVSATGKENAAIINNLIVNIITNSYRQPYIALSPDAFHDLEIAKKENYAFIYGNAQSNSEYDSIIKPMFAELYYRLRDDLISGRSDTIIAKHHIQYVKYHTQYYISGCEYGENSVTEPDLITADFIASMTDDYFLALYAELFPYSHRHVVFKSYFDDMQHHQ